MSGDALAIANLKASYCLAADTFAEDPSRAQAMCAGLFTDDVACNYGDGPLHGPAAVTEFLRDAICGSSVWMVHLLSSPLIAIDGDVAGGRWSVLVHARRRDGRRTEVIGRYADSFRRTAAGWRIAAVTFMRPE